MDYIDAEKKYKVGYTQGVFDMFHIGHLNLINNARIKCEELIVGVNTDKLVEEYKQKKPVISETDRRKIVSCIKGVDRCELVNTLDKLELFQLYKFDVVFIGSDWKGDARWEQTEKELAQYGVDVIYLPYTNGVSSTELKPEKDNRIDE